MGRACSSALPDCVVVVATAAVVHVAGSGAVPLPVCGARQVGYVEETNAGNAIAALKQRLAPECHVCRNGLYVPRTRACAHSSAEPVLRVQACGVPAAAPLPPSVASRGQLP